MIENLESKLLGNIPVTREELIELISSWGRTDTFFINDNQLIKLIKPNECYPLENLDVSQIEDLSSVFRNTSYNGDLSKWNVSSCENMNFMFAYSYFNNCSLKDWDLSNCKDLNRTFSYSNFNGDLSNWDVSNCKNMEGMFFASDFNNNSISNWNVKKVLNFRTMFAHNQFSGDLSSWQFNKNHEDFIMTDIFSYNQKFSNKYNEGKKMSEYTTELLEWFERNREKMREINTPKEEVLDFFSFEETKKIGIN